MVFANNHAHPLFQTIKALSGIRKRFNFNSSKTTVLANAYYNPIYIGYLEDDAGRSMMVVYNFSGESAKPYIINAKYLHDFPTNKRFFDLLNKDKSVREKDGYLAFDIEPYEANIYLIK
jgi:hypothetical protein